MLSSVLRVSVLKMDSTDSVETSKVVVAARRTAMCLSYSIWGRGWFLVFNFQIIPMFVCMECPQSSYLLLYESQLTCRSVKSCEVFFFCSDSPLMSLWD